VRGKGATTDRDSSACSFSIIERRENGEVDDSIADHETGRWLISVGRLRGETRVERERGVSSERERPADENRGWGSKALKEPGGPAAVEKNTARGFFRAVTLMKERTKN